ncbi:MAG TPA: thioredoxin family protein [Cryomorphaceae bacterium]|nr:thioredoxin family protein [Cryomorphaceae bacterium]
MKKLFLFSLFAVFSATLFAQDSELKAQHEGWLIDMNEAYELHKETGKPILANFTGSDWCGWCKKLSAKVFTQDEFKKWADENVILLELDFPRKKQLPEKYRQQNAGLQQAFQVRGYPTVWIFEMINDPETGEVQINPLGKTGYQPSVAEFTNSVEQIMDQSEKSGS